MTRLRGPWPVVLLTAAGALLGLGILEAGARLAAVREERRQGRLGRDIGRTPGPGRGSPASLGQIIRRSDDPRIVYELRPRLDVIFAGGHLTTSDSGYRGAEVAVPKPAGTFRILGIGDSYMFGQGVSDDDTYLAQLPRLMKDTHSGRNIETVNLAVPGFNTVMEVQTLRSRGPALQPDLILVEIVGNDLDLPNFLWKAVDPWAIRRMFLLDFIRDRFARARSEGEPAHGLTEAPQAAGRGNASFSREAGHIPPGLASMVGLDAFNAAIDDLAAFGRARKVPVLALTHGVWFEDALTRTLAHNGIPTLVLRSALRRRARALGSPDYARSPLALSPSDLHPSALGHLAIAEELSMWLKEVLPER